MTEWCAHAECQTENEHRHCAQCGMAMPGGGAALCPFHHVLCDDWAAANRVYCDFIHRRIEPPNVPLADPPAVEWSEVG